MPSDYDDSPRQEGRGGPKLDVSSVKKRYEAGLSVIRKELQDYWMNHAFISGHQWIWHNPQTRRLDVLPRDPDRVQVTINRMKASSRTVISRIMQRPLVFEVASTAADDATIRGAKMGESIIKALQDEHRWEAKREALAWAIWKGGTAGIAVEWDPDAADPVAEIDGQKIKGGDTIETVLTLAEMVFQPGVKDAEQALWWIKAQALPPETVQSRYKLKKKPPADATAGMSPFHQKLLSTSTGQEQTDLTLVLTYYERPSTQRPEGACAVIVNDEFVDGPKDWPFPFKDRLNIAIGRETVVETRWTGDTVCTDARPIQVAFNASWSSIIEHMKNAGNARFLVPQSAIDLIEQLTDLPGEVVPYPDGLQKPDWSSPPAMPAWWIEQPIRIALELDDIMGVHDISRGRAPANIESGYGLSVLAELDSSPMGRLVKELAAVFSRVGTMCLELYGSEVRNRRRTVVHVPGQPPETVEWSGKDLMGQTNVYVPIDQIMPRSRAAMQRLAETALQMGLVQSFEQFSRIAEVPGHRFITEAVAPDIAKARRENHRMAQGVVEIPEEFDAHELHIQEHNVFRKSPRYDYLPPETKQIFEDHVKAHEVLAAELMAAQVAKGAVSPALAAVPDAEEAPTLPTEAFQQLPLLEEGGVPPDVGGMPLEETPTPGTPPVGAASPQPLPEWF